MVLGASFAAALALGTLVFAIPQKTRALCFFSYCTDSAKAETGTPIHVPDSSIKLAQAATNIDPNPNKGDRDIATSEGAALISEVGPVGNVSETQDASPSGGQISLHIVKDGETLSEIASDFGISVNTIITVNNLKDAGDIHPGDELLILPVSGIRYVIKNGGSLKDIAKIYDIEVEEIARFNGFDPNEMLAAGTEVIVPGVDLATKKAPAKSSGSSSAPATKRPSSSVALGSWANPLPGAYISQGIHGHNGVDLAGIKQGTPVYAAAEGKVIAAGNGACGSGYGVCVIVSHPNNTQTLYAHLSSVATSVGATVAKGEHIGGVGNTGRSTGYHLHFGVRGAANPFGS